MFFTLSYLFFLPFSLICFSFLGVAKGLFFKQHFFWHFIIFFSLFFFHFARGIVLEWTLGRRFRRAWVGYCSASFAHAHLDADRCDGCKSHALATPSRRVGLCFHLPPRGIRQPRCVLHCSRRLELGLVTGLAPSLETNLRAEPCNQTLRYGCAGGCIAPITQEAWLALDELVEEKGEHVRLFHTVSSEAST